MPQSKVKKNILCSLIGIGAAGACVYGYRKWKQKKTPPKETHVQEGTETGPNPTSPLHQKKRSANAKAVQLYWEIYRLRDLPRKEIAATLKTSEATVYRALSWCKLYKEVADDSSDE